MPFFAKLFSAGRRAEFADSVNKSVYRIAAASLLATAVMIPAALPLVDLAFRRGLFTFADSLSTAVYFGWFSLSLALWSAQALYSRGFYAAGNTITPMIASTVITALSLPVYVGLYHRFGVVGLAMASDVGILMHTVVLAWLLERKKLVPLRGLPWLELGKAFATAIFAGFAGYGVSRVVPIRGSRVSDLLALAVVGITWLAAIAVGLWVTKSELPQELRRRKAAAVPNVTAPEAGTDRAIGGVEP
jgi:putative peptidoglycan lipid II flippase